MDIKTAIRNLEKEWNRVQPTGFFGKLSLGIFDEEGFKRVQELLDAIDIPEEEKLDKRFVEVTWFMPTYMRWKREEWNMDGMDTKQLDKAIEYMEQRLTTILGLP